LPGRLDQASKDDGVRMVPNYSGFPASIQCLRSSTLSPGQGPSHGMDPALIRSKDRAGVERYIVERPQVEGNAHRLPVRLTKQRLDVGGKAWSRVAHVASFRIR